MQWLICQYQHGKRNHSTFSVRYFKVKSLEQRLKTTEERFHQERNARADNLSQVEEKLLIENARLQVSPTLLYKTNC